MSDRSNNNDGDEGGLLGRWSARKRAAQRGELNDEATIDAPSAQQAADDAIVDTAALPTDFSATDELSPEQLEMRANCEAAEAVDIETLDYESDYSIFQKAGVPEVLRRKAMQKLWRSNPILANVDGLCDYDDDFASPDLILKNFESAYKIGKGYLLSDEDIEAAALERKEKEEIYAAKKAAEREEAERLQAEAEADAVSEDGEAVDTADATSDTDEVDTVAETQSEEVDENVELVAEDAEPAPARRVSLRKRLEMG